MTHSHHPQPFCQTVPVCVCDKKCTFMLCSVMESKRNSVVLQIVCSRPVTNGLTEKSEDSIKPWTICLDPKFSLEYQIKNKQCRVYSLG